MNDMVRTRPPTTFELDSALSGLEGAPRALASALLAVPLNEPVLTQDVLVNPPRFALRGHQLSESSAAGWAQLAKNAAIATDRWVDPAAPRHEWLRYERSGDRWVIQGASLVSARPVCANAELDEQRLRRGLRQICAGATPPAVLEDEVLLSQRGDTWWLSDAGAPPAPLSDESLAELIVATGALLGGATAAEMTVEHDKVRLWFTADGFEARTELALSGEHPAAGPAGALTPVSVPAGWPRRWVHCGVDRYGRHVGSIDGFGAFNATPLQAQGDAT